MTPEWPSDFSATDILTTLYGAVLDVAPDRVDDPARHRFVLSKGHVAGMYYTTLAAFGFLPVADLATFLAPESKLNGHPNRLYVAGVEANTGPLGHGLPIAVGLAKSAVLTGATTAETNDLNPLADKMTAFELAVREIDGHDHGALLDELSADPVPGKPTASSPTPTRATPSRTCPTTSPGTTRFRTTSSEGISARVLSMASVKPLDVDAIVAADQETGAIVTVEETIATGQPTRLVFSHSWLG